MSPHVTAAIEMPKLGHVACSIRKHTFFSRKDWTMLSTYLVAIGALAFSACSALVWVYAVRHFDRAMSDEKPASTAAKAAV
jgi:hypothetical protein